MSLWDSIVSGATSQYDKAVNAVSEGWDNLINAAGDSTAERITGAATQRAKEYTAQPINTQPTTVTPDQFRRESKPFDWQKAGVIIGAVGLAITLAKVAGK